MALQSEEKPARPGYRDLSVGEEQLAVTQCGLKPKATTNQREGLKLGGGGHFPWGCSAGRRGGSTTSDICSRRGGPSMDFSIASESSEVHQQ